MGLLEDRRAQHKARESNRNWGLALSGRSPIVAPMYGDRQAGREQSAITVEPPDGRHLTVDIASQTWDGRLDLGGTVVQDIGWSSQSPVTGATDEATAPTGGYYDLHVDLDTDEVDAVTVSVEIDGTEVASSTLDLHGRLMAVIPLGEWVRGTALTILSDRAVAVSGGRVAVQVIEPPVGRVGDQPSVSSPGSANMVAGDGSEADSDSFSLSTGGLSLSEGDLLVAVHAGYSLDGLQGGDGSMSNPSGWDQQALVGSGRHLTYVLTRTATAGDVSGNSYNFGATAAVAYHSAMIVRIPAANVGTLSAPNTDVNSTGAALSVTRPDGDWTLAVAVGRNRRTSSTLTTVELSSPATTLASHDTGSEKGRLRLGEQDSGDTVDATFTQTSGDPWGALIAFGVTGQGSA